MFSHITIGANDLAKATAFYDAVFAPLGIKQAYKRETRASYGREGAPSVLITAPFNGERATFGNGMMLSFAAESRAAVDEFHRAALACGGADEGAPGVRMEGPPPVYIAYVRDPDGNKLAAMFRG